MRKIRYALVLNKFRTKLEIVNIGITLKMKDRVKTIEEIDQAIRRNPIVPMDDVTIDIITKNGDHDKIINLNIDVDDELNIKYIYLETIINELFPRKTRTYDCWFCSCGRIHPMDRDEFDWMAELPEARRIVRVCQNCGSAYEMFLTEHFGFDDEEKGFDINGRDIENVVLKEELGVDEPKVIINKGIKVPMVHGNYADRFQAGRYYDSEYLKEKYPNMSIYDIEKIEDIHKVDVNRMREEVKNPELMNSILGYVCIKDYEEHEFQSWRRNKHV